MRKTVLALALVALLPACNDDQNMPTNPIATPAPTPPSETVGTTAAVTVTISPQVPAVPTADPNFPWAISWQTSVHETAGVAATVITIEVHLVDVLISYSGADLTAASTTGSAALAARGTLNFNQSFSYSLADGGRLAVVSVVVWLRDSKGNIVSQVAQFRIV